MGSPPDEVGRGPGETQHEVTLTRSFYLKATEVTQGEWRAVMASNPSYDSDCGENCPVELVSWYDALAFSNALSESEGFAPCYDLSACEGAPGTGQLVCPDELTFSLDCPGYRLPTEAEWEYAHRAGTARSLHSGEVVELDCTPLDAAVDEVAWFCGNAGGTRPVASKAPNPWDAYDMAGNAVEWLWDWHGPYPDHAVTDPIGPPSGTSRVYRGGSWGSNARRCRAAHRAAYPPWGTFADLGFRVVRSLP